MRSEVDVQEESITYGGETQRLTDALIGLHDVPGELRPDEVEFVAAFRNMVVEAITDLVAVAVGNAAGRRLLSSVDDLQVAPSAFLSRALRAYPRLLVRETLSPADAFSARHLSPAADLWQQAARHALTSAHIACAQPRLPTAPGDRTTVVADLASIAQVASGLDRRLETAFQAAGDPRAGDLAKASRVAMAVICREVRRQHDFVPGDRNWDQVEMPRALRPMVVSGPGDLRRATNRLRRLLDATSGQVDARAVAAVVQAQSRDHFRLHELLAAHAQTGDRVASREVVAHSVAHLEVAHLLADAYRSTARIASPFKGDRRAVTQAAEIHRAIDGDVTRAAAVGGPAPVVGSATAGCRRVSGANVSSGLAQGKLLVPGWDDDSGGTAWTLAERLGNPAPLRRQLEAIGQRSWSAFAPPSPTPPPLDQVNAVRHRLAPLTQ